MEITGIGNFGIAAANRQHNHPIELSNSYMQEQKLNYLHMNPVVPGFVLEPEYWRYSSAIDYAGGKGLIEVCIIK